MLRVLALGTIHSRLTLGMDRTIGTGRTLGMSRTFRTIRMGRTRRAIRPLMTIDALGLDQCGLGRDRLTLVVDALWLDLAEQVEVDTIDRLTHLQLADDLANRMLIGLTDERHNEAVLTRTAGAARAMHVVGTICRRVEVHNAGNLVDVDAARRDVCRHEHRHAPGREGMQRTLALRLRPTAVQVGCANAGLRQLLCQTINAMTGAAERDHRTGAQDEIDQNLEAIIGLDLPKDMRDVTDGLGLGNNLVSNRILLIRTCNLFDLAIKRGREQQGLAIRLRLIENALDHG